MIREVGTSLRRAASLLVLHLSGNPGLSNEMRLYLHQRIKCRPNEDMHRFQRISNYLGEVFEGRKMEAFLSIANKMRIKQTFEKAAQDLENTGDRQLIF